MPRTNEIRVKVNNSSHNFAPNSARTVSYRSSRSENQLHSVNVLHNKLGNRKICKKWNSKPIVQLTIDGKKVKDWTSAFEVQRILGISESCIRKCLYGTNQKGRQSYRSHGYKWVYAKDYYK